MRRQILVALVASAGLAPGAFGAPGVQQLSEADVLRWQRHLVPLPKQMELKPAVMISADRVSIVLPGEAPALARQAVTELREALGAAQTTDGPGAEFTLRLQIGGKEAEPLRKLPNADQAYRVIPAKGNDGLLLVGGGERGLYYAAKTLQQFIKANPTGETAVPHQAAPRRVRLPLATITDWPDMEDRGLWGGDSYDYMRWMSDRKMNIDEQIATNAVDSAKRPYVNLGGSKARMIAEGPRYGINPLPVVLHLEQISGSGLFEAHPELKGKDGKPGTICYSNPLFADILAQWLLLWREKPGVKEVDVWMAENLAGGKGCQCESCAKEDRSVLEARAIVAGWRKARAKDPELGIRVLTSEETEKANPQVFKELPPEVKLWYYHSLFTYNTSEKPMIRRYLVDEIEKGRWVGVCPNLAAEVGFWQPFTGAHFIHYRMTEFVSKKLSGLIGYAVPNIAHTRFNTEAAAEWTWNNGGRTPREFAISWAVREGIKDPEKFAVWSDLHGPVAWDVYGSAWPAGERRKLPGSMAELLRKGKLPELGYVLWDVYPVPWGDIKTPAQLAKNVKDEERALTLARELGDPAILQETLVVHGHIRTLSSLWRLKQLVGPEGVSEKDAASRHFRAYVAGLEQARVATAEWEKVVTSGRAHYTGKTVETMASMIEEMKALAAELGCAVE